MKGVTLSNLLAGRVFITLFREVFSKGLSDCTDKLVEDVKDFMQKKLGTLCDRVCARYPVLLKELKTNLIQEFIDGKKAAAKSVIDSTIRAEIGWVFTQDQSYEDTIQKVNSMVGTVRQNEAVYQATMKRSSPQEAEAVGCVPKSFIAEMVRCPATSEESSVRSLQVSTVSLLHSVVVGWFE